jgi:very-long-chain ceramide synthase
MLPRGEFSTVGPCELDWATEQYKCPLANGITFTLLAFLQALNVFWLSCLLRSAYCLNFMGIAKDDSTEDDELNKTAMETVVHSKHQEVLSS